MKKIFSILLTILMTSIAVTAQNVIDRYTFKMDSIYNDFGKTGNFVLKGQVKKFKNKFFEFATTNFLTNTLSSVIVNPDGTFEQQFPVSYEQKIYLYLNDDVLTFSVSNNDTLTLNWEDKNFKETFKVESHNKDKNLILQTELELFNKFRKPYLEILQDLDKNRIIYTTDQKYNLINNQFNERIKLILDKEKARHDANTYSQLFNNLIAGEYYTYADMLRSNKITSKSLSIIDMTKLPTIIYTDFNGKKVTGSKYSILVERNADKSSNERYFLNVPSYREYLYDYIRMHTLIKSYSSLIPFQRNDILPEPNFTLKSYYTGKASLEDGVLADWYATKLIISDFGAHSFSQVEKVYHIFLNEVKTPFFKAALTKHYNAMKHLKSGLSAPNFTLKNDNNKEVSLADFKGKVVYIDFWGVDCGPCIMEIEDYTPKLHEKYTKDVVFLNICIDSNEKKWKSALKKHKVGGINLIAEGWDKHPVSQAYNVSGIPHYVLINKDGTIASANAPRPSDLLNTHSKNPLEIALKSQ